MAWLSNGITLRKAAQVLGPSSSSKRAGNVKSPAWTMSWLIQNSRDCVWTKLIAGKHPAARTVPADRQSLGPFATPGKGRSVRRYHVFVALEKLEAYSPGRFLS